MVMEDLSLSFSSPFLFLSPSVCSTEKDVARTDRHLECFKEIESPLMLRLTRILRAFSIHNSAIGM